MKLRILGELYDIFEPLTEENVLENVKYWMKEVSPFWKRGLSIFTPATGGLEWEEKERTIYYRQDFIITSEEGRDLYIGNASGMAFPSEETPEMMNMDIYMIPYQLNLPSRLQKSTMLFDINASKSTIVEWLKRDLEVVPLLLEIRRKPKSPIIGVIVHLDEGSFGVEYDIRRGDLESKVHMLSDLVGIEEREKAEKIPKSVLAGIDVLYSMLKTFSSKEEILKLIEKAVLIKGERVIEAVKHPRLSFVIRAEGEVQTMILDYFRDEYPIFAFFVNLHPEYLGMEE